MTSSQQTTPFVVVRDHGPDLAALSGAVVAMGNFDGVHRGHRAVIDAATARAAALGRKAVAVTFEPHPRSFFRPDEPFFRLSDDVGKLRLLAGAGLAGALVMTFDAHLANLTAEEFLATILVDKLAIAGAAVGFDFHFGRDRRGSPDFLSGEGRKRGFPVDILPPLEDAGRPVSSSTIRAALAAGRIEEANELLGHPWFDSGVVQHGDKRGRELGYPTANLQLDPACRLMHGIYAVRLGIGERRVDAVASYGRRPTFDNGGALLEVHAFDFAEDLYGQSVDVAFIAWIRPELRFESVDALIAHMHDDSRRAREALAKAPDAFPKLGRLA